MKLIRSLWSAIATREHPKEKIPESVHCRVHVIGGPLDRSVMRAVDYGTTLDVEGMFPYGDEYDLSTWRGMGETWRLLIHRSFNAGDVWSLLLNEYCDKQGGVMS